jgi:hypothetical protein
MTSTPVPLDSDRDGIPNLVEEGAPNDGDSDGDGLADSLQSEVAAFPNVMDGRYLTLIAPTDSRFEQVTSEAPTLTGLAALPQGATTPYGLLHFTVEGISSKKRFALILLVPDDTMSLTYWKYGGEPSQVTPHWYVFSYDGVTGAEMNGRMVTLWFLDSARGDDDLTVNKILVDLGGLLLEGSSEVANWSLY